MFSLFFGVLIKLSASIEGGELNYKKIPFSKGFCPSFSLNRFRLVPVDTFGYLLLRPELLWKNFIICSVSITQWLR